jgi:hypothetical protein
MVLLMYWENDNEDKRKARREEKLRAKKLGLPEPEMIPAEITNDSSKEILEILSKQTAISLDQSKKIDQLSQIILEQQKIIDKISDQRPEVVTREIIREVPEGDKPREEEETSKKKFMKLDDIDVNVIDTSGIEAVGETVGTVTQGQNIKSQVEKLKKLRKRG